MKILIVAANNVSTSLLNAVKEKLGGKENVEIVDSITNVEQKAPFITPMRTIEIHAYSKMPEFFIPIESKNYTNGQTYKHKKRK